MTKKRYIYDNSKIKEGDIFYSSWGYDQTNIDYYKVTKLIGKASVELVPIESRIDYEKSTGYCDAVVPYPASEGKPMQKKIKYAYWDDFKEARITMNTYANAYQWDGQPKMQTNAYYGR
jgi:hypothetical protein